MKPRSEPAHPPRAAAVPPHGRQAPVRTVSWAVRALAVLVSTMLLAGCQLRLETAPPSEPSPDSAEITREAAVVDVLDIQQLTSELLKEHDEPKKVRRQLRRIKRFAGTQLTSLGGVYHSGLASADAASPSATPDDEETNPSPRALVRSLGDAYSRSRAALGTVPEAEAARLYASVAASQLSSMRTLANTTGVSVPKVDPPYESLVALPGRTSPKEVAALVVGEDSLGYAREILAARLSGDARKAMADRAQKNRARAARWAAKADLRDTDDDPRQVVYSFKGGLPTSTQGIRARVAALTLDQAHRISALMLDATADERAGVADLLALTYQDAVADGAHRQPLPGLPEYPS